MSAERVEKLVELLRNIIIYHPNAEAAFYLIDESTSEWDVGYPGDLLSEHPTRERAERAQAAFILEQVDASFLDGWTYAWEQIERTAAGFQLHACWGPQATANDGLSLGVSSFRESMLRASRTARQIEVTERGEPLDFGDLELRAPH